MKKYNFIDQGKDKLLNSKKTISEQIESGEIKLEKTTFRITEASINRAKLESMSAMIGDKPLSDMAIKKYFSELTKTVVRLDAENKELRELIKNKL